MVSIIYMYYWLIFLNLLWLDMWAKIDPTGQVWSTWYQVVAAGWCICGQWNKTTILRGRKRWYIKLTLFTYVYFTGYISTRSIVSRIIPESVHRFTTRFGTNQFLHEDAPGHPWLHHCPGSDPGCVGIWYARHDTTLEVYQDKRVVSVESQDIYDLLWYIFWR